MTFVKKIPELTPNPDELRLAVRTAVYPNSEAEKETIARIDKAVFDRTRVYETQAVENAEIFVEETQVHVTAADEIVTELRREIRFRLAEGSADAGGATADRYETLRLMAEQAIGALEHAEREAEWHAAKCESPYENYIALTKKWPTLRPLIAI